MAGPGLTGPGEFASSADLRRRPTMSTPGTPDADGIDFVFGHPRRDSHRSAKSRTGFCVLSSVFKVHRVITMDLSGNMLGLGRPSVGSRCAQLAALRSAWAEDVT